MLGLGKHKYRNSPPRSSEEGDWLAEFQTGDLQDLVSYLQTMQKASDLQLS